MRWLAVLLPTVSLVPGTQAADLEARWTREAQQRTQRETAGFERACRQGDPFACLEAGRNHDPFVYADNGEWALIERSLRAALPLYREALRLYGMSDASPPCYGQMLFTEYGLGVPRDETPLQAHAACCEGFGSSCGEVGALYERGKGVPRSEAKALVWYQRGCEKGESDVCAALARLLEKQGQLARARRLYEQQCFQEAALCPSCDDPRYWRGHAESCQSLATLLRRPGGLRDEARARAACARHAGLCQARAERCAENAERCGALREERAMAAACSQTCATASVASTAR
jgi:TPR repeat protein